MAVNSSFTLQEAELSCPICFEEFSCQENDRIPKLLLCLHTFCMNCVQNLRKLDGSLQCSICRTNHKVYQMKDLLDNYVVVDYLRRRQMVEDEKFALRLRDEYAAIYERLQEQERQSEELVKSEKEKTSSESVVDSPSCLPEVCSVISDADSADSGENLHILPYRSASSSPESEEDDVCQEDQGSSHSIQEETDYEVHTISDNDEYEVSTDEDGMETAHSSINHFVLSDLEEPSEESNSSVHAESEITSDVSNETDSEKQDSPTPQHLNVSGASPNSVVIFSSEEEESDDDDDNDTRSECTDSSDEDACSQTKPQTSQCSNRNSDSMNLNAQLVVRTNSAEECSMQ